MCANGSINRRHVAYKKVFGIGLNKTGTTSLKIAFQALGFRHLDRTPRLFRYWQRGEFAQIYSEISDYQSFEDWPWPLMVRDLLEEYGEDARFVLTRRRSAEAWVDSLKQHAERTNPRQNPRKVIYGYDYPHGREAQHIAFYEAHLRATRALFSDLGANHLLAEFCWEEGHGWDELCAFLNRPVPKRDFPIANRSTEAQPDPEFQQENRARIERILQSR